MSSSTQNNMQTSSDATNVEKIARFIAKRGLKYEKRMMLNLENPRYNFLRNPEDPLHGYYKQKLSEYLSQIQEHGAIVDDDAATNTSTTQVITEPPPGIIRNDIERMASFISKKRSVNESMMMRLYADNARYRFMFRSDPFHAFYKQKLTEYSSLNEQDGANHNQDPLV